MSMCYILALKCLVLLTCIQVKKLSQWECAKRCIAMTLLPARIEAMDIAWQREHQSIECLLNCLAKRQVTVEVKVVRCISQTRRPETWEPMQLLLAVLLSLPELPCRAKCKVRTR